MEKEKRCEHYIPMYDDYGFCEFDEEREDEIAACTEKNGCDSFVAESEGGSMPTKECETQKVFSPVEGEMREFTEIKGITHIPEIYDKEMIDVFDMPCRYVCHLFEI